MPNYAIWYKNVRDGSAPDCVFLNEDYALAGEMESTAPTALEQKLRTTDPADSELHDHRDLGVGDVVTDGIRHWIKTPQGIWALVQSIE